jgi:FixJ family two-component response regulator
MRPATILPVVQCDLRCITAACRIWIYEGSFQGRTGDGGTIALRPIICIIEDDEAVRESLRLMLELHGYYVEEFEDGERFLARERFDNVLCIILDLNLPGENGLRILSRLRAHAVATPTFIVTGRADAGVRREAKRLDALALFEKPLPARELLAAVATIGNMPAHS